jgi:acetyltransferase-like isoleucine patch superfamily enzyme
VICVVFLEHLLFELAWVILFPVQYVPGTAGDRLRRLIWRFFLGGMGKRVHIDIGVQFVNPRFIFVGDDTWIDKYAILIAGPPYEGKRILCRKPNQEFPAKEGELHIGSRCHIAPHSLIQAHGGVWIGNELTIASGSRIYSMSHHYRPLDQPQRKFYRFSTYAKEEDQALIVSPVVIKNGAAVGLNAVVMPGAVIGENSWVGTNSLVQGIIPPNSIATGVPAKVEREIVLEPVGIENHQ